MTPRPAAESPDPPESDGSRAPAAEMRPPAEDRWTYFILGFKGWPCATRERYKTWLSKGRSNSASRVAGFASSARRTSTLSTTKTSSSFAST